MTSSAERRCARRSAALAVALGLALAAATGPGAAPTSAANAPAAGSSAPPQVEERVAAAIAARWGVPAERVRLAWGLGAERLAAVADAPLALAGDGGGGWLTARFGRGADAIAASVRASVERPVAVAARPLAAGRRLDAGDVRITPERVWGPPEPTPAAAPGPGWTTRRPVAEGERLVPPAVAPPWVVAAGRPVRVVWAQGSVRVSCDGVALNDAAAGGRVRVRTAPGAAPLDAIARAPGMVELDTEGRP
jgi:flagella basal body P-ring formation protein FlgA